MSKKNFIFTLGILAFCLFVLRGLPVLAAETTPPSVPTGLSANAISTTRIDLTWATSTDTGGAGMAGYYIYRNNSAVGFTPDNLFSDTGLATGTTYTYSVSAVDNAFNESATSTSVTATTVGADSTAPTVPTGLTATPISSSQIYLAWATSTDSGSGLLGYYVYRNGSELAFTPSQAFLDLGLNSSTAYTYRVSSVDNMLNRSAQSNAATTSTQAVLPNSAPTTTVPASANPSTVNGSTSVLYFQATDDGGASNLNYVWQAVTQPSGATPVFSTNGLSTSNTTTVTFDRAGSYQFRVTATDSGGLSTSSTVSVTVNKVLARVIVSPSSASISVTGTVQFAATSTDQFGMGMPTTTAYTWSATSNGVNGSINASTGVYTALNVSTGTYVVTATSGGVSGTSSVSITRSTATAPTFSPSAGTYTSNQTVTITCPNTGATIRWTTDGTTPTGTSNTSTSVTVSSNLSLKAYCAATGFFNSPVSSADYVISIPASGGGGGGGGGGSGGGGGGGGSLPSAPTGASVSILNGAAATPSLNVSLNLSATGASLMAISNDQSFANGSWINFASTMNWTLSGGTSTVKTVYAKFRNSSGGETSVVSDSITYSTSSPPVVVPVTPVVSGCPAFNPGDMIKVVNKPAIYSVNSAGMLLYFPSGVEFKSWNKDEKYGGYTTVDQSCFESLPVPSSAPFGVNVRPGSYVIKKQSSDQLYVVLPNSTISKISRAAAAAIYGSKFKPYVIQDVFWINYGNKRGADIVLGLPHPGMLIKYGVKNYYVDYDSTLREISASGFEKNNFKQAFVHTVVSSVFKRYKIGSPIVDLESSITDRTQSK